MRETARDLELRFEPRRVAASKKEVVRVVDAVAADHLEQPRPKVVQEHEPQVLPRRAHDHVLERAVGDEPRIFHRDALDDVVVVRAVHLAPVLGEGEHEAVPHRERRRPVLKRDRTAQGLLAARGHCADRRDQQDVVQSEVRLMVEVGERGLLPVESEQALRIAVDDGDHGVLARHADAEHAVALDRAEDTLGEQELLRQARQAAVRRDAERGRGREDGRCGGGHEGRVADAAFGVHRLRGGPRLLPRAQVAIVRELVHNDAPLVAEAAAHAVDFGCVGGRRSGGLRRRSRRHRCGRRVVGRGVGSCASGGRHANRRRAPRVCRRGRRVGRRHGARARPAGRPHAPQLRFSGGRVAWVDRCWPRALRWARSRREVRPLGRCGRRRGRRYRSAPHRLLLLLLRAVPLV
mmetsp:Transcript_52466/g.161526  ORF Transcript_52466/g.161526 Transcript_52466/m.161526 type:complete len:407 (-) Transcript_52466:412-1632(-)